MAPMPKVYLETAIPSYLTAWSSRDLVQAAHQQITREWWERRERSDLFISQLVLREAGGGDAKAAELRLDALQGIRMLTLSSAARALAEQRLQGVPLPNNAAADALHIGIATANGMDYLLTWNCAPIANAAMRQRIEAICRGCGYQPPVLCTPEELMED
jgi:hypothetical protein